MRRRLYVLVRRDLSVAQQAVQAGHAIAEWCVNESSRIHWDGREVTIKPWRWTNETLVLLGVSDEAELKAWYEKLKLPGTVLGVTDGAVFFKEPYFDYAMTALAVVADSKVFEELELL